jgi:hypothetical protein
MRSYFSATTPAYGAIANRGKTRTSVAAETHAAECVCEYT